MMRELLRDDGPLRRLPAGPKLAVAVALVLAFVLLPHGAWPVYGAGALLLAVLVLLGGVPLRPFLQRLLLLEPFVLGVALLTLLQPDGLSMFLALVARSTLCLSTMLLLAGTTPLPDLLQVLRTLRVPALLVTTLALMYRYLFVLADEARRMQRACHCRTFAAGTMPRWKTLASVVGQLFVRAAGRAERIHAAMLARGFR
jgi:cobalt/nickel transport system permease protein